MSKLASYLLYMLAAGLVSCGGVVAEDGQPLRIVVETAAPSSFVVGGERYGYVYELCSMYAGESHRELALSDHYGFSAAARMLDAERVDGVVTIAYNVDGNYTLTPLYDTDYIIVTTRKNAPRYMALRDGLRDVIVGDAKVMLGAGFDRTASYAPLLDSLRSAHIYSSAKDINTLAQELLMGTYTLLVCERSQAMLILYMYGDLAQVYEFAEQVSVNLMLRRGDEQGRRNFEAWLARCRTTADFRALTSIYMEHDLGRRIGSLGRLNRIVGGISIWDDMLQKVGASEGVDWLLLSAIAYHESRFDNTVVSSKGATGLMQIMPVVARNFRYNDTQLTNPEINITIAARLLRTISRELRFPPETPQAEQLAIMLAAYNCGIGIIQGARSQARENGANPDSWSVLDGYVSKKQTSVYVADVMRRYEKYQRTVGSM